MPRQMQLLIVVFTVAAAGLVMALTSGRSAVHAQAEASANENVKKVVFVAGTPSHGYGAHEHHAGSLLLSKLLNEHEGVTSVVYQNGWPDDESAFEGADAIVIFSNGGGGHPAVQNLEAFTELVEAGVGVVVLHWATGVPAGEVSEHWVGCVGANKEPHWSVNPHWTMEKPELADHPINRGVKPYNLYDEWYFHLLFRDNMEGVTPIMSAHPPESTMSRPDGDFSGNPHVRQAMERGEIQHVAWAAQGENNQRSFGLTGIHFHWNLGHPLLRRQLLNAIAWTAHMDIPEQGMDPGNVTFDDLLENQDYDAPDNFDARRWKNLVDQWREEFGDSNDD